jgi:outer membrane protein OmpA-like peptidoglycan-associated protein
VLWAFLIALLLGLGVFIVFGPTTSSQSVASQDENLAPNVSQDEPTPTNGSFADVNDAGATDANDAAAADTAADAGTGRDGSASSDTTGGQAGEARDGTGADVAATADPAAEPPLPQTEALVYFEPNRTRLTDGARRELDELASVLRANPEVTVSIIGHTALYGTEEGRMEISQGRAQGVASYLRSRGWEPAGEPSIQWVGSQDPVTRDRDEQHLNRRVEISIGAGQSSR